MKVVSIISLVLGLAGAAAFAQNKCELSVKKAALVTAAEDLRANEINVAEIKLLGFEQMASSEPNVELYNLKVTRTSAKSVVYQIKASIFSDDPGTDARATCHPEVVRVF